MSPARGPKKDKARIYHSHISKTPEGIRMRFTGDTQDSKFADSGGYVFVDTDQGEAMFILENADIRAAVDQIPQKQWVTVRGEGKGDGAWIIIDEATSARPDTPTHAKPQSGPPPMFDRKAPSGDWQDIGADAADIAAFVYGRMEVHGHPLDSAGKASFLSTVFIAMDRRS